MVQPCESCQNDRVAQSVEHLTFNQVVVGSTPTAVTIIFHVIFFGPAMPDAKPDITHQIRTRVKTLHQSLFARLRRYFFAGILVTAPVAITIYLTYIFVRFVDDHVAALVPPAYYPHTTIPGIGLVIAISFFTLVGWLTRNVLGRLIVWVSDYLLERLPVVRIIYGALKQIFETLMAGQSTAFREVVVFQDSRPGIWALGFVTGALKGPVQTLADSEIVNVFRPFTPNPTSGLLLLIPRKDLIVLTMTVEEAIKLVVSGGIITPPEKLVRP
jgi:uncharacterized membrane protein